MKTRESIDRIVLDDGALPQSDSEAVLEKCYAYHHELQVSDAIPLANVSMRISDIGSVTDYDSPSAGMNDYSSNSEAFGLIFVTGERYRPLLESYGTDTNEIYIYAYRLAEGTTDEELRKQLVEELGLLPHMITFVPVDNNSRMNSAKTTMRPTALWV